MKEVKELWPLIAPAIIAVTPQAKKFRRRSDLISSGSLSGWPASFIHWFGAADEARCADVVAALDAAKATLADIQAVFTLPYALG